MSPAEGISISPAESKARRPTWSDQHGPDDSTISPLVLAFRRIRTEPQNRLFRLAFRPYVSVGDEWPEDVLC